MNTNDTTSVTWGKTSWLALIAALAQFAAALVIYLFAPDDQKAGAIAPLVTAASTLYALVKGHMDQATAKAHGQAIATEIDKAQTLSETRSDLPALPPAAAPDELDDDLLSSDDPPPEAALLPSTDPDEIPADEGDAGNDEEVTA